MSIRALWPKSSIIWYLDPLGYTEAMRTSYLSCVLAGCFKLDLFWAYVVNIVLELEVQLLVGVRKTAETDVP